jgi:hypothetical protein
VLLKAALQRAGLLGNAPMRGYAVVVAKPARKLMVSANQLGTKRVAVQAAPQMPALKSRPSGSNRALGWPSKAAPNSRRYGGQVDSG